MRQLISLFTYLLKYKFDITIISIIWEWISGYFYPIIRIGWKNLYLQNTKYDHEKLRGVYSYTKERKKEGKKGRKTILKKEET